MYQLNVHLRPGDLTHEGHPFTGVWGGNFHPEFFTDWSLLKARQAYYRKQGIKAEPGDLTARVVRN